MKAIILAAGYATRLYPLTLNTPKALLPIRGKPIVDYIIDQVDTVSAIDKIYIVSNHKFANHFIKWRETSQIRDKIKVIDDGTCSENERLGAIGDIQYCIDAEKITEDCVVIAGDTLFTFPLNNYYSFFINTGCDCICYKQTDDETVLKQGAIAVLSEDGKVIKLAEKSDVLFSNNAVFAVYIYKKQTMGLFEKYLSEGNTPDAPGYFAEWLSGRRNIFAYKIEGDCYDIGIPEMYDKINTSADMCDTNPTLKHLTQTKFYQSNSIE